MRPVYFTCILILLAIPAAVLAESDLAAEVRAAEAAFAKTMVDRDLDGFKNYLDPEAVFVGKNKTFRGRDEIVRGWSVYYKSANAPFTWEPEIIEVLNSGYLAHSSGPVYDKTGQRIATYNTVWRKSPIGRWLVVFDKGCEECPE